MTRTTEESEMTAEAPTKPRQYRLPSVRCTSISTAHPSSEAWATSTLGQLRRPSTASRVGDDAAGRFERLQRRMTAVERASRTGQRRSLVVVPSRTIGKWREPAAESQAYEERLLCSLLSLRDPEVRMTYATSSPVAEGIVGYYLSLLPPRIRRSARSRLTLVALGQRGGGSLSHKLMRRPDVLERIRRTIPDPAVCHLVPYNTTELERDVALALDVPMYGADPVHSGFGTKSGSRRLFASAGVPHPVGVEGINSTASAVAAIAGLRAAKPELSRLVMKLNEGVSGEGNALIDLAGLPAPGAVDEAARIAERIDAMAPEAPGVSAAAFLAKLAASGGIVEEWITGTELQSPSAQLQITPWGEVQLVSTHDQILGGPSGQSYLGCRFPAAPSYAPQISALARRVGERLAGAGVIGRFAIDFVVARDSRGGWRPFAIEVNLRKGGTTHPYETLAALTGGSYNPDSATFISPTGQHKHYVATDHLEAPVLRALGRDGVLALTRRPGLRFDPMRRVGPIFHMLSSIDELGRTGFTAIADSAEEADELYAHVTETLLREARAAAAEELPDLLRAAA
jgi:PGM1 C-terminal domain